MVHSVLPLLRIWFFLQRQQRFFVTFAASTCANVTTVAGNSSFEQWPSPWIVVLQGALPSNDRDIFVVLELEQESVENKIAKIYI